MKNRSVRGGHDVLIRMLVVVLLVVLMVVLMVVLVEDFIRGGRCFW